MASDERAAAVGEPDDEAGDESGDGEAAAGEFELEVDEAGWVIQRAVLNESELGRQIQSMFVEHFGSFMRDDLRPILRQFARDGEPPQLLVNGLAELMRSVADSIEFPVDHPRAGFPPQLAD